MAYRYQSISSPLSSVGMPYYSEQLLSAWPAKTRFDVGQPTPQIDPEVIRNMKTIDFVGYAPNPGNARRNQAPRKKKHQHNKDIPKFRSEQERELLLSSSVLLEDDDEEPKVRWREISFYERWTLFITQSSTRAAGPRPSVTSRPTTPSHSSCPNTIAGSKSCTANSVSMILILGKRTEGYLSPHMAYRFFFIC